MSARPSLLRSIFNPGVIVLLGLITAQFAGGLLYFVTVHPGDYYRNAGGLLIAAAAVCEGALLMGGVVVAAVWSRRPQPWERELDRQAAEDGRDR